MKTSSSTILIVYVLLNLLVFNLWAGEGKTDVSRFLLGDNYRSRDFGSRSLYVTFLKEGYTLEMRDEHQPNNLKFAGIPPEAHERCCIIKEHKIVKMILSLDDFRGYVTIDSEEKAIEFVRFRTSYCTYFLFRPEVLFEVSKRASKELGKDLIMGGASPDYFEKNKLEELKIVRRDGYFEIARDLLYCPWPGASDYPGPAKVFRAVERVYWDGQYQIEKTLYLTGVRFWDIPYPSLPR